MAVDRKGLQAPEAERTRGRDPQGPAGRTPGLFSNPGRGRGRRTGSSALAEVCQGTAGQGLGPPTGQAEGSPSCCPGGKKAGPPGVPVLASLPVWSTPLLAGGGALWLWTRPLLSESARSRDYAAPGLPTPGRCCPRVTPRAARGPGPPASGALQGVRQAGASGTRPAANTPRLPCPRRWGAGAEGEGSAPSLHAQRSWPGRAWRPGWKNQPH